MSAKHQAVSTGRAFVDTAIVVFQMAEGSLPCVFPKVSVVLARIIEVYKTIESSNTQINSLIERLDVVQHFVNPLQARFKEMDNSNLLKV